MYPGQLYYEMLVAMPLQALLSIAQRTAADGRQRQVCVEVVNNTTVIQAIRNGVQPILCFESGNNSNNSKTNPQKASALRPTSEYI